MGLMVSTLADKLLRLKLLTVAGRIDMEEDLYIAYDTKLYRPGCVLVQAAMGGSTALANEFPTELWLLAPTPDMKLYPVHDKAFLDKLIAISQLNAKI
jgi:hypothetical protein